jgi:hypothetical protein
MIIFFSLHIGKKHRMGDLQFCHGIVFGHKQNKEKNNFISWVLYTLALQEGDDYLLLSAHMGKYTEWVFFNFVMLFFIVKNKNIHTQKHQQDNCYQLLHCHDQCQNAVHEKEDACKLLYHPLLFLKSWNCPLLTTLPLHTTVILFSR